MSRLVKLLALLTTAVVALVAAPMVAHADIDPVGCTPGVQYDPAIPTWDQVFGAPGSPADIDNAFRPFASGAPGRSTGKNPTVVLDRYFDAVTAATAGSTRVAIRRISVGQSEIGGRVGNDSRGRPLRRIDYWVVSTPRNIANFDDDSRFWSDVRDGNKTAEEAQAAARTRPAIGWVTATPHGNEPAAGEAIARQLYELAARLDCQNLRRLQNLDVILDPVRNPDGRDNNNRTTAWGFDPNRDFGVRNYKENSIFLPEVTKYPGVFFIDAHQQGSGYFFPPNEDPVHHEISKFSLDFIQGQIGPKLQQTFNDQSGAYQNYNSYDLFVPEYGDTVPSLLMGAAGMTYEKGSDEAYGKQVYDHYLAIDTTLNLTSDDKVGILQRWSAQWPEAVRQGNACELQRNSLVSPLHQDQLDTLQQPNIKVCGYFYRPDLHEGDVARLMKALREVDVKVFRLGQDTAVTGLHEYGKPDVAGTLPAGTLWIPMGQAQKHWIQSILGEDPFIPYNYYYDVVTWSYGMQRGLAGDGFLTAPLPSGTPLEAVDTVAFTGYPSSPSAVYAFDTDSMSGLALTVELLDKGVNVYRGTEAFDVGGAHFETGAALVDAGSVVRAGVDLKALAAARNTPITGLGGFPVLHQQLTRPKIALYAGAAVPTNPLNMNTEAVRNGTATSANNGHCTTSTTFCEALFALTQKDGLPASLFTPITSAQIAAGALGAGGYTALVNPGIALETSTTAENGVTTITDAGRALAAFVTAGGTYLGSNNASATAAARGAGLTTLNTTTIPGLLTPGSTFDATFRTTNPVAWGFDRGGWIYRDSNGNPVFDPASLGAGTAVVSYAAAPMRSYGYSANALGNGQLGGRPAVVDVPTGAGRSILFGFNPYYRSWKEQDERLVLNALLYPRTAVQRPSPVSRATAADAVQPDEIEPVVAAGSPAEPGKPLTMRIARTSVDRDVLIRVARRDATKLKAAVKRAKLRKALRRKVGYRVTRTTITLVVRGARRGAEHDRAEWATRVLRGLGRSGVRVRLAQL